MVAQQGPRGRRGEGVGAVKNIRAAMSAAAQVWAAGLAAVCPHANAARMEGVTSKDQRAVSRTTRT